MNPSVELGPIVARSAGAFAALGVLDEARPLLEPLDWDGHLDGDHTSGTAGVAYARGLDSGHRHNQGIHYTPGQLAGGLVRATLGEHLADHGHADLRVGDPACGAGVFLVAAAEALHAAGSPVDRIVDTQLFGADLDPVAVALARIEVALWATRVDGRVRIVPEDHLVVADALAVEDHRTWTARRAFLDVVVGNPPFGAQLRGDTVRDRARQRSLAATLGVGALGYVDTAALFLLRAVDLVRAEGHVTLILPTSVAATKSARGVREAVGARARCTGVWVGRGDVGFDAEVAVWAPMFRGEVPRSGPIRVRRFEGPEVRPVGSTEVTFEPSSWAPLLAADLAIASVPARAKSLEVGPVASIASITAGFRQHFYGLTPHVHDDPDAPDRAPTLVTTGAIDPLRLLEDRPIRFAGRDFDRPVVDLDALRAEPSLGDWVRALLVPKVLVASQGRVLEVVVDVEGTFVPSTPVIAVVPDDEVGVGLWHLAAALASPLESARLHLRARGTGMDGRSCRVTAGFVGAIGIPTDPVAWDDAADAARQASDASEVGDAATWDEQLRRLGAALVGPHDPGGVLEWWNGQRPQWRGARLLNG